ncbi:MAG: CheY-like chemotaxis protein [Bermanella sp.]|jgi:CheY-like chemotaxis protein
MATATSPISKQKTALVVDDSKLARYVLKEMLIGFGIKVETSESAEEALGSLSAFRPDVIFMDHMMPGMDGFQAVQAIKNDPKTATIPILMYTSKDDGMYVSQARALGAVGVLPKKLKPVQLEKVLIQLRLVSAKEPQHSATESYIKKVEAIRANVSPNTLEELSRSASEEQEKDSMRLLFRKLFSEQRDSIKQDQWQLVSAMAEQITPAVLATRNKMATWQIVASSGLFMLLTCILILLYGLMNDGDFQQQKLQIQIDEQKDILLRLEASFPRAELNQDYSIENFTKELNIKPMEWAINQNSQLSFYQTLSSVYTQGYVTQLINQLDDFGFNGSLYIQFHTGRYCQQALKDGQQILVSAEKNISQCQFNLQSINNPSVLADFEQFLIITNQDFPNINMIFEPIGTQLTVQDYPEILEAVTAGQWNKVAEKNNRFNFVLVKEG